VVGGLLHLGGVGMSNMALDARDLADLQAILQGVSRINDNTCEIEINSLMIVNTSGEHVGTARYESVSDAWKVTLA
jgi:hypothetical protein